MTIDDLWEHRRDVHAEALRILRDPAAADDVVQDTYLRAYHKLDDLDPSLGVKAWLMTVARRRSLDEVRRRNRHAVPVDEIPDPPAHPADEVHAHVAARESLAATRSAFAELHPRERELLLARVRDGCSMTDLAEADGSSVRAVESVLSRARSKLAAAIERGTAVVAPVAAVVSAVRRRVFPGRIVTRTGRMASLATAGATAAIVTASFVGFGSGASDRVQVTGGETPSGVVSGGDAPETTSVEAADSTQPDAAGRSARPSAGTPVSDSERPSGDSQHPLGDDSVASTPEGGSVPRGSGDRTDGATAAPSETEMPQDPAPSDPACTDSCGGAEPAPKSEPKSAPDEDPCAEGCNSGGGGSDDGPLKPLQPLNSV